LINLGDGFEEDDDSDFCGMCVGMRLESAWLIVLLTC
jgi:hypothetical protein